MYKVVRAGLKRLRYLQSALCLLLLLGFYITLGGQAAYSALLGSLICFISSQYFAAQLFKSSSAQAAKTIVKTFYRAEAVKLLLLALMFAIVFIFININALVFFISFMAVQASYWLAPFLFRQKTAKNYEFDNRYK